MPKRGGQVKRPRGKPATSESTRRKAFDYGPRRIRGQAATAGQGEACFRCPFFRSSQTRARQPGVPAREMKRGTSGGYSGTPSRICPQSMRRVPLSSKIRPVNRGTLPGSMGVEFRSCVFASAYTRTVLGFVSGL